MGGPPAGRRGARRHPRPARRRRHPRARPGAHRQLLRPAADDHPVGEQPLHGTAHRTHAGGLRRRLLGVLDARRHVGRRHGVRVRPAAPRRRASRARRDHAGREARAGNRAAVRDGSRRLRFRDQRAGLDGGAAHRRRRAASGRVLPARRSRRAPARAARPLTARAHGPPAVHARGPARPGVCGVASGAPGLAAARRRRGRTRGPAPG